MKNLIKKIEKLPLKRKIGLGIAVFLTISLAAIVPVYAWFANQKKAAEMYKIEYPNSLYINAAHREDRVYFNLDEIDLEEYFTGDNGLPINYAAEGQTPDYRKKTHRLYAFSVSGEGTTKYTLQLAHTNNNELTYTIYEAGQTKNKPNTGYENFDWVHYDLHDFGAAHTENKLTFTDDLTTDDAYYTIVIENDQPKVVPGQIKNQDTSNAILAKKDTTNKYYIKTYGDENLNVEAHAVPTYWQANITLNRSDIDRNTKQFHKYYILEVSWDNAKENSKETDLIYLAVKRAN